MTILEMLISAALVTIVLVTGAAVFSLAVKAQKNAAAVANTMDSFSTISSTLERDFSQIITDAPLAIWFDKDGSSTVSFFAHGNYDWYTSKKSGVDPLASFSDIYGNPDYKISGNVGRFIITSDASTGYLLRSVMITDQYNCSGVYSEFPLLLAMALSESAEYMYDDISLLRWKTMLHNETNTQFYLSHIKDYRDTKLPEYPMLMTDGLASFSVQLGFGTEEDRVSATNTNRITRWFPDGNPYTYHSGSDSDSDSDFGVMGDSFGVYFNMSDPTGDNSDNWYRPGDGQLKRAVLSGSSINEQDIQEGYMPVAIKLTYKFKTESAYASERVFTQIIYLN